MVSLEFFIGIILQAAEMSTRNIGILEYNGGRCIGLITLPPSCADCLEIWEPQPPGTLSACTGIAFGHMVAQMVEALSYKPEGCGFDSRWCH